MDGFVYSHSSTELGLDMIGGKEDLQKYHPGCEQRLFMGFDNWVKPQLETPFIWT